jgi:hypothetical protein
VRNAKDRAGGELDEVKIWSGKYEGLGQGVEGVEPNIIEITHMCIMHGAHTNVKVNEIGNLGYELRPITM